MAESIIQALTDFANWLISWPRYFLGYLLGFLKSIYESLMSKLHYLWEHILSPLWDQLQSFVDYLDVQAVVTAFNALSEVGYYLELFNIPMLLGSVLSASAIRFLVRRLPIIG